MTVQIFIGDCRDVLKAMPDNSVHCVVTSPPYFGLRDYGTPPVVWGGDDGCDHVWGEGIVSRQRGSAGENSTLDGGPQSGGDGRVTDEIQGQFCQHCNAWLGNLGLEPSPSLYVAHMVEIFRDVRRVLREDGVLWLNLGDSYAGSWGNYAPGGIKGQQRKQTENGRRWARRAYSSTGALPPTANVPGLKPKDLIGIPWRVALALQDDGWWLRSEIIWAKGISFCDTYSGSCMPESVRDRPTKAHEHVFLLTKSARYFYDAEAVRENFADERMGNHGAAQTKITDEMASGNRRYDHDTAPSVSGRNLRTVWAINSAGYPGSHFATFPPALVEPMIAAGTSERGCCSKCGAPWKRVVEKDTLPPSDRVNNNRFNHSDMTTQGDGESTLRCMSQTTTTGWKPTCTCNAGETVPCTVFDPFGGSGTTALQADRMGRDAIIAELNETYATDLAYPRIAGDAPLFSDVSVKTIDNGVKV